MGAKENTTLQRLNQALKYPPYQYLKSAPSKFRCEQTDQGPRFLAQEILGLTKMNWNDTQFDGGSPITIAGARYVGSILKYLGEEDTPEDSYSYYM